jgi:type I restriction enzyme S subunit
MIADLKPYPAYRDSGVPWLGKVPDHWAVERLKSLVSNVVEQTAEREGSDVYSRGGI